MQLTTNSKSKCSNSLTVRLSRSAKNSIAPASLQSINNCRRRCSAFDGHELFFEIGGDLIDSYILSGK